MSNLKLTREECLFALESLKPADIYEFKAKGYLPYVEANSILTQLIEEHFELVELLKKHDLENLSIKELDTWFDRSLWHVNKVNELSNQLVECQRVLKQKQEKIEELTSNPPLKFEELKLEIPYWDNKVKCWCWFATLNEDIKTGVVIHIKDVPLMSAFRFEENRFYKYEVKKKKNDDYRN